ncbi:tudor domain-containing protein 5 isoform X2 [Drosophila bipectinata]|uniref:tudor domain-containing protein 5 isoform X2 n=1 Tax=Drosophila bipectinata TaxID=42026 RepID=UPI001C8960EA|nr:tudor domain-containing protein 5 isoform X2 [Drosophila bipectinata]
MEDQYSLSYVKKVLHSLVVSSPNFMTIDKLQRDYRSEEGCNVPYARLGYKSLEGFLRDLTDTFTVRGTGLTASVGAVASSKSGHIQQLVQQQKKQTNRKGNRGNQRTHYQTSRRSDFIFINEKPGIMNARQTPRSTYQPQVAVSCQPNYSRLQYPVHSQQYMQQAANFPRPQPQRRPPRPQPFNMHVNIPPKPKIPERRINSATIVEIVDSLSNLKLDNETEKAEKNLPEKVPDVKSVPKPPCSSDDERSSNTESEIILKDPFTSEDEKPVDSKVNTLEKQDWISSDEDEHAKQLPKSLDTKYDNNFNGYSSSEDGMDEDAIPAYALDDRVLNIDYPVEAVRSGLKLPQRDVEDILFVDDRIEVQLVRVDNPHQFYFWIYNTEIDSYKAMNSNMQEFYDSHSTDKYIMPLCLLTTGHLCVVRSTTNGLWQRAEVLRHRPGNKKPLEVKLVDTGHVMNVSYTSVKYLVKEFANLPAQCFIGRLAYVTPWKGHSWSADAVNFFFKLVCYRRLYAKIESIKDDNVYVVLVDPDSKEHTRNLNKALIDSGWVRRCYTC